MTQLSNNNDSNVSLEDVLRHIGQADHQEVEELIHAICQRFSTIQAGNSGFTRRKPETKRNAPAR